MVAESLRGGGGSYLDELEAAHVQRRELPEWEGWPLPVSDSDADADRYEWIKQKIVDKFHDGNAISWYRGKAFQQISLLQIAEHFIVEIANDPPLIPGGPLNEKVKLPTELPADGFHVYVSPNNAGALDFVYQVCRAMPCPRRVSRRPAAPSASRSPLPLHACAL